MAGGVRAPWRSRVVAHRRGGSRCVTEGRRRTRRRRSRCRGTGAALRGRALVAACCAGASVRVLGDVDRPPDHLGADRGWRPRLPSACCPALSATPVSPPRPTTVAATATRRLRSCFTSMTSWLEVAGAVCGGAVQGPAKARVKTWQNLVRLAGGAHIRRYSWPHGRPTAPGGRILVVEDEESISEPFAEALRRAGFEPHGRPRTAAGALELAAERRARPGDARPRAARRRRPRRLPRAAPPLRRADRDADRARHRDWTRSSASSSAPTTTSSSRSAPPR